MCTKDAKGTKDAKDTKGTKHAKGAKGAKGTMIPKGLPSEELITYDLAAAGTPAPPTPQAAPARQR